MYVFFWYGILIKKILRRKIQTIHYTGGMKMKFTGIVVIVCTGKYKLCAKKSFSRSTDFHEVLSLCLHMKPIVSMNQRLPVTFPQVQCLGLILFVGLVIIPGFAPAGKSAARQHMSDLWARYNLANERCGHVIQFNKSHVHLILVFLRHLWWNRRFKCVKLGMEVQKVSFSGFERKCYGSI